MTPSYILGEKHYNQVENKKVTLNCHKYWSDLPKSVKNQLLFLFWVELTFYMYI